MQGRDAVDGVAADDGQMGHADMLFAIFPDDRHAPHLVDVTRETGGNLFEEVVVDLDR